MEFNSVNNFIIQPNSAQKAGLVKGLQNQQTAQPQAQNLPLPQSINQAAVNPSLMYDFQLAKMDNETILKYLQNLMKLPNSIDKFVNQMSEKVANPKLALILAENMISVKMLSEFLNQNSADAISKLMQTISQTLKSGASDVSQLKEILSILNAIQSSTNINSNTLKELLLLYIPLNVPVFDKNVVSAIDDEEEKEAIKNSKLSILFETINFSNLLVSINEVENNFFLDVFVCSKFLKEEFIRIVQALSKEANISSIIDFKNKQDVETRNIIQNFKILSDGFISPNALILAHIAIKAIFKIDSNYNQ
ncbi:MAG: hypothetical protein E7Z88_05340 [Cyanobacteria bacterium SIG27]|nr:hypothetical protein [Cyanobacteria bacterium SIG27]